MRYAVVGQEHGETWCYGPFETLGEAEEFVVQAELEYPMTEYTATDLLNPKWLTEPTAA